jgi:hypothetical protein
MSPTARIAPVSIIPDGGSVHWDFPPSPRESVEVITDMLDVHPLPVIAALPLSTAGEKVPGGHIFWNGKVEK